MTRYNDKRKVFDNEAKGNWGAITFSEWNKLIYLWYSNYLTQEQYEKIRIMIRSYDQEMCDLARLQINVLYDRVNTPPETPSKEQ